LLRSDQYGRTCVSVFFM